MGPQKSRDSLVKMVLRDSSQNLQTSQHRTRNSYSQILPYIEARDRYMLGSSKRASRGDDLVAATLVTATVKVLGNILPI